MFKYHVTKFFIDEDNQVTYYPTEILDSRNQVFEYAQDFFNNKKLSVSYTHLTLPTTPYV